MFTRKGPFTLLTLALASTWSFGAAADPTSFELGSYLGWPGGKAIAAHDYEAAIKSASIASGLLSSPDPLVAATNLCVAYTKTAAFPEAREACDRAVVLAHREDGARARGFSSQAASSHALSNRGVLRALTGDSAGAANDFREAAALKEPFAAAKRNLAYLESSPAYRVALADGSTK